MRREIPFAGRDPSFAVGMSGVSGRIAGKKGQGGESRVGIEKRLPASRGLQVISGLVKVSPRRSVLPAYQVAIVTAIRDIMQPHIPAIVVVGIIID